MAITQAPLTSGSAGAGTSIDTASITPTGNRLILIAIGNHRTAAVADIPTVSGNDLTWEQVNTRNFDGTNKQITLLRAMGASPSTGVVTISFANANQATWAISEFNGVKTSGSNGADAIVQSVVASAASTGLSLTLAAFASVNNGAYGTFCQRGGAVAFTAGTGFTEIHEVQAGSNLTLQTEWRADNDTSVDVTTDTNDEIGGVAVELAADPGGGGGSGVPGGLRGLSVFRSRGRRFWSGFRADDRSGLWLPEDARATLVKAA